MPTPQEPGTLTVALLGNPNTGKSTLFNALAGVRQRVGNYPGVTVEKRLGTAHIEGHACSLLDLPGTYSLAPRSIDEMVTVDVLLGRVGDVPAPDVLICIVDASNLTRNLYLVSQALELNRPLVLALNMTDIAARKKIAVDAELLSKRLGVPVVETQANRGIGLEELRAAVGRAIQGQAGPRHDPFPPAFREEIDRLAKHEDRNPKHLPRFLLQRLLLDVGGYLDQARLPGIDPALRTEVEAARERLAASGHEVPGVETAARYAWVEKALSGVVLHPRTVQRTWSDRLDSILMHKIAGTVVFLILMLVMFQAVFQWAVPAMHGIEWLVGQAGNLVGGWLPAGAIQSLLVDGVIGGVGGVLTFLPQIMLLFALLAVLEDCGYLSRAAYLADRLMSSIGLSGKAFIPLLSSFACAVPGIMATRVIENRQERLITILIAPLMSCSARLPVYVLLIAAFVPPHVYLGGWLGLQGITMTAAYMVGIVTAIVVAMILKRFLFRQATPAFVMELPSYKFPSPTNVLLRVIERAWRFLRQAGTLILAASVVVWALAYYPRVSPETVAAVETGYAERGESGAELDNELAGLQLRHSVLGRVGRLVEPVVRPLGWDWRIGCAVIASFPAREVVISTMGVIYNLGDEQDETSEPLRDKLHSVTWEGTDRPVFNVPVALSLIVFFALCAQCAATLVVIRKETNSWLWPLFTFGYMTGLAYLGALATYQIGMWLTL